MDRLGGRWSQSRREVKSAPDGVRFPPIPFIRVTVFESDLSGSVERANGIGDRKPAISPRWGSIGGW